jgi:hypothetical protein
MPEVIYRDGRSPAQRIADRLKPSCPTGGQVEKETAPTRTVTTVFYGGSQQQKERSDG